jgi:hypothetical protein
MGMGRRTNDAKENLGPSESTGSLVPIFEHLEHGSHLSTGIHHLVLNDHKLIRRRMINLDDPVQRIGCVGGNDIKLWKLRERRFGRGICEKEDLEIVSCGGCGHSVGADRWDPME